VCASECRPRKSVSANRVGRPPPRNVGFIFVVPLSGPFVIATARTCRGAVLRGIRPSTTSHRQQDLLARPDGNPTWLCCITYYKCYCARRQSDRNGSRLSFRAGSCSGSSEMFPRRIRSISTRRSGRSSYNTDAITWRCHLEIFVLHSFTAWAQRQIWAWKKSQAFWRVLKSKTSIPNVRFHTNHK